MDTPNETKETKNTLIAPNDPYMDIEFDQFLKNIGNAKLKNWSIYAGVLGVSRSTIERWKKHPLAQAAILEAIAENMEAMEKAGRDDWRMHREKLKMFGIEEVTTVKISPTDVGGIIGRIEKTNYDELSKQLGKQSVAPNEPVQNTK